jgi:YD repeat-containing protein
LALPEFYEIRNLSEPYHVEAKVHNYDLYANITELNKNEGLIISYVWGYNGQLLTAEVKNAGVNEVYLEDFENSTFSSRGDAYTGNKYHLGDFQVTWEKPGNREYLITYRYREGGSWKLSQEPFSAFKILTLGDAIDDIRIYPKEAEITTYTYNPLVGVTSVTDPNGKTTYYEYDGFGRLWAVKDHERNVVRSHEYHYIGGN